MEEFPRTSHLEMHTFFQVFFICVSVLVSSLFLPPRIRCAFSHGDHPNTDLIGNMAAAFCVADFVRPKGHFY